MNSEQLNSARLARWSQNGEARLTLEAASEWLGVIGLCCYLPTGPGSPPSASFLEAMVGRPARIPSAGERNRAHELMARMVESSSAVPLKLGPLPAESPDSLASLEVFRYIYALRGNRNLKADPSTVGNEKVTPLALHCWQSIREQGPLDLPTLQSILGRDMTEAAMARALQELWAALYVCPIPSAKGQPAQWEMLSHRFPQQTSAGASTGQAEALSAVVSLYLYSVVAATEDEILAFLSPLAPQSKLREVVRGLNSMRQLDMIDIGGRAHLCLQGGLLPEMVAQLSEEQLAAAPIQASAEDRTVLDREPHMQRGSKVGSHKDFKKRGRFVPKKFVPGKFAARDADSRRPVKQRFNQQHPGKRPNAQSDSPFPPGRSNSAGRDRAGAFGFREREAGSTGDRKPMERGPGERARRWEKSGEQRGPRSPERAFTRNPSGFRSAGSKPRNPKRTGPGSGNPLPWPSRKSFGASAPPQSGEDQQQRPGRWENSRSSAGAKPAGRPYSKAGGYKSSGQKPWASRTGAAPTAQRNREGGPAQWKRPGPGMGPAASENRTRPFAGAKGGSPAGAKPWGRKFPKPGDNRERQSRGEASETRSGDKPRGKSGAKPFWAKNPRGGKGATPSARSNRPRGGKAGGKSSGKKK